MLGLAYKDIPNNNMALVTRKSRRDKTAQPSRKATPNPALTVRNMEETPQVMFGQDCRKL